MRIARITMAVVLLLTAALLGGCQPIFGYIATLVTPPKKVPAAYSPPKTSYLVFVDHDAMSGDQEYFREQLTLALNEQLKSQGIASSTVDYKELLTVMDATRHFRNLSVSEIGRHLDARVVLYVSLEGLRLRESPDHPLWHPQAQLAVRMVDVDLGRLWPDPAMVRGFPLPPVQLQETPVTSPLQEVVLSRELARKSADRIAKLFYDHRQSEDEYQRGRTDEELGR